MRTPISFILIALITNCSPLTDKVTLTTKDPDSSHTHIPEPPEIDEAKEYPDYSKFASAKLRNKPQYLAGKHSEDSIFYLGSILTNDKHTFHIITSFLRVQAAIVKHGHYRIYFLDSSKKTVKSYTELGNLPFKLKNNSLYFKYSESQSSKTKLQIVNLDDGPPKVLCIAPNDCYWPY